MFGGATIGGLQPGPTTGNIATGGDSGGGGGGDGLSAGQVQALIDTSLAGAVQPSSVTTSGQVKTSAGFSFDVANEGEESEIVREANGGLVLRRGIATFLTCSPFSGASFGVNLTTGNLTVNGTFTAGGISGVYSSAAVDNLLSGKQPTITTGSLPISHVANLTSDLASKQPLLSGSSTLALASLETSLVKAPTAGSLILGNAAGTGITVASNGGVGILKASPQDALDVFGNALVSGSLTVSGSNVLSAIAAKRDALTSSTALSCGALTVGGALQVTGGPTVFRAQSGNDNEFSVISGGESYNSKIFLGTPYQPGLASKCCLIAEGITSYSRSTFHIALNNDLGNGAAAGISDSRLSITSAGAVTIPGSLSVSGSITLADLTVNNPTSHTQVHFQNTNSGYTNFDLSAQGCSFRAYPFSGCAILATNTAHSIAIRANQYVNSTPGLVKQSDNAVVCNTTFTNNSDASLKTDVVPASTVQALEVLKAVEPKMYKRVDLQDDLTRLGFIAQDFEAALPPE